MKFEICGEFVYLCQTLKSVNEINPYLYDKIDPIPFFLLSWEFKSIASLTQFIS